MRISYIQQMYLGNSDLFRVSVLSISALAKNLVTLISLSLGRAWLWCFASSLDQDSSMLRLGLSWKAERGAERQR